MQLVQIHNPPWGENDWEPLDLSDKLLYMITNLEADGQVQLPDVDGLPTFILNKAWRTYSMFRLRDGNRKRGVRIITIHDPSPVLSVPNVDLDAGLPLSWVNPALNLNPPLVGMKRKEISIVGLKPDPLSDPRVAELKQVALSLLERYPRVAGWKFGASSYKDTRRFDSSHYDSRWFDTGMSVVLACDIVTNERVVSLEQCLIDLPFSVNHNASGISCTYSPSFSALIYAVPLHEGLSIDNYWDTHKSYYIERQELGMGKNEARSLGLIATIREEREMGLRASYLRDAVSHDGGDQPTTQVHMGDEEWVRILIGSGLDLSALDRAMKAVSCTRLNRLTSPILKSTPEPKSKASSVLKELQKLTSGKSGVARDEKFKRIKPIYWKMRKAATRE